MALPGQPTEPEIRQRLRQAAVQAESGNPVLALQELHALLMQTGHEQQAQDVLQRLRTALQPSQLSSAAVSLIDMMSGLAIANASEGHFQKDDTPAQPGVSLHVNLEQGLPILQETGRDGIASASMMDGSSYQCSQCGGIVSQLRAREHNLLWCPAALPG